MSSPARSVPALSRSSLAAYLVEIGAYPVASRKQEAELGRRIREGDAGAVDELVCANLRFVVVVAKKYQHQGVALEDLINEGNIGLMRAAQRFDDRRDIKFITYAVWWIRQAIIESLAAQSHSVRVPVARFIGLHRLGKRARELQQELGRDPTVRELANEMCVSEQELEETTWLRQPEVSLDAPISDDGDGRLLDILVDERAAVSDEGRTDEEVRGQAIERALGHLQPREAAVLRMYYGIGFGDAMTMDQIGGAMGITRERVRQLKQRALGRLRHGEDAARLAKV